jgi:hypothetical protein
LAREAYQQQTGQHGGNSMNDSSKVLFLGGIGDVFCYSSNVDMHQVKELYWVSRTQKLVAPLITQVFPDIKQFTTFEFEGTTKHGFFMPEMLPIKNYPNDVDAWSPCRLETMDITDWHRCPFLDVTLCEVKQELPPDFWAVCPYTPLNNIVGRDFDKEDWDGTLQILEARDITGVVLDIGFRDVPEHPRLINLQRMTNLSESIEIVKMAKGMISIDSCLSVLGAQILDADHLHIKCVNSWFPTVRGKYYHPHQSFDFVSRGIRGDCRELPLP